MIVQYDEDFGKKVETKAKQLKAISPNLTERQCIDAARMSILQEKANVVYGRVQNNGN